jgi:hypothetical protein
MVDIIYMDEANFNLTLDVSFWKGLLRIKMPMNSSYSKGLKFIFGGCT